MRYVSLAALLVLAALLESQPSFKEQVGPLPDGSFLLNSGWRIQPAGRQIPLDTFPMATALSPDGKYLLILNGGYNPPSISVFSVEQSRELSRVRVADAWLGLTFSPNGRLVYVGGGSRGQVLEFTFSPEGQLAPSREYNIFEGPQPTYQDFIGDLAVSPDGHLIYAADMFHDTIAVVNPQSGRVIERFKTGRRPYRILFHPGGKSFYVSSWADGTLWQQDATNGSQLGMIRLGPHATDMVWRDTKPATDEPQEATPWKARLFVTASNTNSVYVVGITEGDEMRLAEAINVGFTPRQSLGMTPSAVGLSTDQNRLFVVCSDANAVAVVDVSEQRSHVLGFLPTGWYPTAVRELPDKRLVVLNGRGVRSYPNPKGPNPLHRAAPVHGGVRADQYVAAIQTGTASLIDPLNDEQLAEYSQRTIDLSPYRDKDVDIRWITGSDHIYMRPGRVSPIEHVIYIVKENRTYDQVLGDIGKGNSDPSLVLFGEQATPNEHKLAREFVLFDNFYVNADVSADGHNWATAGIAPDYTQKMWPNSYAGRRRHYDYEGGEPANTPPAGYIWTNALAAGISLRNYGYFATNLKKALPDGTQIESLRDPALRPYTNMHYRSFDLDYPDVGRAKVFLKDLAEFEGTNQMPQFIVMRLGNDHTSGTTPGKIAPLSSAADNDYALGLLVEGVSKSKFWASTAIFVIEDDAQDGPDHVDSHRSPAFLISPYTRRGVIDSTMYNQASVLRTMELILGMRPMTQFDAAARPMTAAFAPEPDGQPYTVEKPRISLVERNPARSATAEKSEKMDFSEADRIDDDELNDILWRAIRKTDPPPPVRSYFSRSAN